MSAITIPSLECPVVVWTRPSEEDHTLNNKSDGPSPQSSNRRRPAGLRVLITVCVHGNEPCGWKALMELAQDGYFGGDGEFWEQNEGIDKLTLVLANPEATRANRRFIDTNLNRIFLEEEERTDGKYDGYEYTLREKVKKYIDDSDWYLDIHSTSAVTEPFAIPLDNRISQNVAEELSKVTFVLEHLLESLEGTTMHWARRCRRRLDNNINHSSSRMGLVVECGQHDSSTSVQVARQCIIEVLRMATTFHGTDWDSIPITGVDSIVLTCRQCQPVHHGFRYVRDNDDDTDETQPPPPEPFSFVPYQQVIARDDVVGDIACPFEEGAYLIMPTAHSIVGEEAWFWGRPKSSEDAASMHGRRDKKTENEEKMAGKGGK